MNASPPHQGAPTEPKSSVRQDLVGIGGWLKFLCISLTILLPASLFLTIVAYWIGFVQSHGYGPSLGTGQLGFPLLFSLFITIFGIVAGKCLWDVRPNAIFITKQYLIYAVIASIIGPFVSYYSWNENPRFFIRPSIGSMIESSLLSLTISIVMASIWWYYLNNSERVHNTYFKHNYVPEKKPNNALVSSIKRNINERRRVLVFAFGLLATALLIAITAPGAIGGSLIDKIWWFVGVYQFDKGTGLYDCDACNNSLFIDKLTDNGHFIFPIIIGSVVILIVKIYDKVHALHTALHSDSHETNQS